MKKIAVLGVGAIGALVGGRLALGGQDVTLICTSWRANVEHLKSHSNSIISWHLVRSGIDLGAVALPAGGRAPGRDSGIVVARRQA